MDINLLFPEKLKYRILVLNFGEQNDVIGLQKRALTLKTGGLTLNICSMIYQLGDIGRVV